jgi:CheY-like chemotaxis protein
VQDSVRRRCLAAGVQGFIEKPVTLEKLRGAMAALRLA